MTDVLDILSEPTPVFERLKVTPRWFLPFAAVVVLLVAITWLKSCLHTRGIVLSVLPLIVAGVVQPAAVMFIWLGLSTFLYSIVELLKPENSPKFRQVFAVVAHCGVVFGLGELVNFLLTQNSYFDHTRFPVMNRFPVGLDLFVWGWGVPQIVAILLHSVNVFTVWYFVLLSRGLRVVGGLTRSQSRILAASVWLLGMSFIGAMVAILGGTTIGINTNP
ncbi:MAG TPA: YIP1 family protein [Bacteroidota bacterium]|nr:YIP1 family protein [Bacteroidota bacterium]